MSKKVLVALVAALSLVGTVIGLNVAQATGTGGTLTVVAPGTVQTGQSFNVDVVLSGSVDPHSGFQVTIQYDPTLVTVNTHSDLSLSSGVYGAVFCPTDPPNNPSFQNVTTIGAPPYTAPPGLQLAQVACVSTAGPTTNNGAVARFNMTALAPGAALIHLVSFGPPDNGGAGAGSFTINAADNTAQSNTLVDATVNIILPPPDLSVTKTQDQANPIVQGNTVSYTITVNNPSSTTPATNVVATDTLPGTVVDETTSTVTCSGGGTPAGAGTGTVSCTWASIAPGGSETMTVSAQTDAAGTQNNCVTATLNESDPNTANNTSCVSTQVIPPNVSWFKDPASANLWVAPNAPDDPDAGVNVLDIDEVVQNFGDPDGLGAYEFQLKFDDKLFELPIQITDSGLLGSTGRSVDCTMTILLENLTNWACASFATGPNNTPLGPSWTGNQVLATVHLDAKAELVQRIRPTLNNGVVTPLFDENCELADIWGNPGDNALGPNPGSLLGGILPGGQVDCQDAVVTIRMLEGDVNLDCQVTVSDAQAEAFRYGAFFGVQLYNKWYDLEPQQSDLDIDIKDVQFVTGRVGSTCANPLPPQNPGNIP